MLSTWRAQPRHTAHLDVGLPDVFHKLQHGAVEQVVSAAVFHEHGHDGLDEVALEHDAGVELNITLSTGRAWRQTQGSRHTG